MLGPCQEYPMRWYKGCWSPSSPKYTRPAQCSRVSPSGRSQICDQRFAIFISIYCDNLSSLLRTDGPILPFHQFSSIFSPQWRCKQDLFLRRIIVTVVLLTGSFVRYTEASQCCSKFPGQQHRTCSSLQQPRQLSMGLTWLVSLVVTLLRDIGKL